MGGHMSQLLRYFVLTLALSFVSSPADAQSRQARQRQAVQPKTVQPQVAQPQRRAMHTGHIEIITDPPGFEVFVNGTKRAERTNATLELLEGKYQIELFLPATSFRHSFAVEILPADVLAQRFDMRGSLRVDSFWVQDGKKSEGPPLVVHLDGARISQGQRIDKLAAGMHDLQVSYGGMKKAQRVDIRPGSVLQVNYSLPRGQDAGLDPGRVPN
jgi:hypothetical protein